MGKFFSKNLDFHWLLNMDPVIMSTPLGGGYIIFAFFAVRCPMSGVRCPASRMVSAHLKEKY